jgi:hypothetical protein
MKKILFMLSFALLAGRLPALDFWRHPEMADKGSLFVGGFGVSFSLEYDSYFELRKPELYADYLLGVGIPFSVGVSVRAFEDGYFAFGLRPAYHINLGLENFDLYFLYSLDLVFSGGYIYMEYGGRAGLRWRLGRFPCLHIETGHKFDSANIGVSIKLN